MPPPLYAPYAAVQLQPIHTLRLRLRRPVRLASSSCGLHEYSRCTRQTPDKSSPGTSAHMIVLTQLQTISVHLEIPDNVYNWLVEFFQGHFHCTRYGQRTSALKEISGSIVQGSAIGPASYIVTASDLTTTIAGNLLCKYADDTYLIIPAQNYQSRSAELDHSETWSARNNLHLNRAKCVELIISEPRRRRQFNLPPCTSDITRVSSL